MRKRHVICARPYAWPLNSQWNWLPFIAAAQSSAGLAKLASLTDHVYTVLTSLYNECFILQAELAKDMHDACTKSWGKGSNSLGTVRTLKILMRAYLAASFLACFLLRPVPSKSCPSMVTFMVYCLLWPSPDSDTNSYFTSAANTVEIQNFGDQKML